MARREQKPTEQLNLKPGERCQYCAFLQADRGRVVVVKDALAAVKAFPCLRYPQPVLKELGDWCGEFKAR
jgi:hypothetical protein